MKSTEHGQASTRPSAAARAHRGTILAVDDRPRNVELLQQTLGNEGYEVIPAGSGAQALDCVALKIPDLILLDVMMPEMDGFEVCRRLRHDPRTADVAVIFLSAAGDKASIVRGIQSGGVDYVTKPFTKEELLARVNTHVTLKHLLDRNRSLLLSRQRLIAEEMEDLKRPLRSITRNLGEIARSIQPASDHVKNLLDETLTITNYALSHVNRELLAASTDFAYDKSTEFPVSSIQLQEIIGQWYLSSRRRSLRFKMSRLPLEVQIACHLSPLTYLIDLIMSFAVNTSQSGEAIHVKIRLHEQRLQLWIEHATTADNPASSDDADDVQWLDSAAHDLQLTHEAKRLGASLRMGSRPNAHQVMVLSLPVQAQPE